MTKQEILDAEIEKIKDYWPVFELSEHEDAVLKAMDEYAKQECIGFDMWQMKNYWQYNVVEGFYFRWDIKIEERATPEQLYDKFLKSKELTQ